MTVETSPGLLQNKTYPAEIVRRMFNSLMPRGATIGSGVGGLVGGADCKTVYSGSGLKVQVEPGELWVPGSAAATQGTYYTRVSAAETLTPTAANGSLPRIDTVIMRVKDSAYSGAENVAELEVLKGTATSGANLSNLTGKAAPPENSYTLAYVLIPAAATTITNSEISNVASTLQVGTEPVATIYSGAATLKAGELAIQTHVAANFTLPSATTANQVIEVFNLATIGVGVSVIKVTASGGAKIYGGLVNGLASIPLSFLQHVVLQSDGTNWYVISGETTSEEKYSNSTYTQVEAEGGVVMNVSRPVIVNLRLLGEVSKALTASLAAQGITVAGVKLAEDPGLSCEATVTIYLNPGQMWKLVTAVNLKEIKASTIIL